MSNWNDYLTSLSNDYAQWWNDYTLTDVVGQQRVEQNKSPRLLDFTVVVLPTKEERSEAQEKTERLDVLAGLRKYAQEHVLLVGRPGSGKSTALVRLLLEEAEKARSPLNPPLERGEAKSSKSLLLSRADKISGESFSHNKAKSSEPPFLRGAGGIIPVLVELRYYETSVLDLIRDFLKRHRLLLDTATIEKLLFDGQFLLLVDGINELPSATARQNLYTFRQDYEKSTPMIFTTRDLGVGGDLGITKKLEMQPLTAEQMQQFVRAYLPEQGEQMLQNLGDRLREFGETPLLLWMLCSLFEPAGDIPANLGLVFRKFTQIYNDKLKPDIQVTDESRRWWTRLLEHLAFYMTTGDKRTELNVAISRLKAEEVLTQFLQAEKFDKPRDRALEWLQDLLKHHLIQIGANDKIEFRHQLIQEYYTAECLLKQLPNLNDNCLQREYLNYLKWTEPLKLMLELVDDGDGAQAVQVVNLALEVDLQLGAKLAGAVKPEFQQQTVDLVAGLEIPLLFKITLLGLTKSNKAIPGLIKLLEHEDSDVRWSAASALGEIKSEAAIPGLIKLLEHEDSSVRWSAASALGKIKSEAAIPGLIKLLEDEDSSVRRSAASALGKIKSEAAILQIMNLLKNQKFVSANNGDTLRYAVQALEAIQENCQYYKCLTQPKPLPSLPSSQPKTSLMYILHLSDLHFGTPDQAKLWSNQLAIDLQQELEIPHLDALILSGDIADKSTPPEYAAAQQFFDELRQDFPLQPEQIIIVPGNHDLNWQISSEEGYIPTDRKKYQGSMDENCVIDDGGAYFIGVVDPKKYKRRFEHFSNFYQTIKNQPYPLDYDQQYTLDHFPNQNLLILGLNSAWQLDHHYKSRANINMNTLSNALTKIRRQKEYENCIKIAVWHHPLDSAWDDRIKDQSFMEQLTVAGFRFFLHGHVHQAQKGFNEYDAERGLFRICAGTFGAPTHELTTAEPWQYHLMKLENNTLTVRSRKRKTENGAWEADNCWRQGKGKGSLDSYTITWE
ncbi:HEAT repeat domain-containing protein [Nodularia spumigena]|uniref:HEAT repeat domain-containing protein n=3 Tax=Nodularia spumigena TaxID=70799 RepID=A0ABU5UWB3_NODSP|nr:HEAT repeat domain-containing protein [Nodularia spumigena]MEA5609340.1 HEAT repeat domain-containing protein [Nodularia spumigena UHCC 0060]